MSCNSYGYLVVGIGISRKSLSKVIENEKNKKVTFKRVCDHQVPENAKFCPECGKPRVIEILPKIDEKDFLDKLGLVYVTDTDDYNYFITTNEKWIAKTQDINASGSSSSIPIPTQLEIEEICKELENKLSIYDLYDYKKFRIWVVGCCYY